MIPETTGRRIAFLTSGDPTNKRSWSGIDYYMAGALARHCGEICYLGCITPTARMVAGKVANKLARTLLRRQYSYLQSFLIAKGYAKRAARRLKEEQVDILFVPSASAVLAFLEAGLPTVYLSGTTFSLMKSYYPQYSNLLPLSVREGDAIERRSIERAGALIYPTDWPVLSAVTEYGADAKKIHVVPYGANLDPVDVPTREAAVGRRLEGCRLLFLGVDWHRKGGEIAFDTLLALRREGIDAHLTVCGCTPHVEHPAMTVVPFLDKNRPDDRAALSELFLSSDFLILPTRNECFGVVFCEAGAFGLPSISTATGGVPGVVRDGVNGLLLPVEAGGEEYARVIAETLRDEERYMSLVAGSRREYEERLNWDVWGKRVSRIISAI